MQDVAPGFSRFRLKQVDFDGAFEYSPIVEVAVEVPGTHLLSDVYPNPFNPTTTFSLVVSSDQRVRIDMYDVLGRHVRSVFDGSLEAEAPQTFSVEADGLPSGTYVLLVRGENFRDTRRAALLK